MKQIIILFLLIASINFSQNFWEPTNGPFGAFSVSSIVINSEEEIFLGGSGIYRCSYDLENWTEVYNRDCRILAINSSDEIFAVCDSSIYHSSDNGINWSEVSTGINSLATADLLINSDDDIFLAHWSAGILRSVDNGSTWISCNSGLEADPDFGDSTFYGVRSMYIDNTNNDIYVGTNWAIFKSINNGDNWTKISEVSTLCGIASNCWTITTDSNGNLFAGVGLGSGSHFGGLFKSADNGVNWTEITYNGTSWDNVSIVKVNSMGNIFVAGHFWQGEIGFYASLDNGITWEKVLAENEINDCKFSENNEDIFVAYSKGIYYSNDKGENWQQRHSKNVVPTTVTCLDATSENVIIAGTYYENGIFSTNNKGENWTQLNNISTHNFSVWCMLVSSKNNIFVGDVFTNQVYRSKDNGITWDTVYSDKQSNCIENISTNSILLGTDNGIYLSNDNGDNWLEKNNGLPDLYSDPTIIGLDVNSAIINSNGNIIIGTSEGIYHSSDNCESWSANNNGLPNDIDVKCLIENINGDLFAGCWNSNEPKTAGVFRSIDNGITWKKINNGISDTTDVWCIANTSDGALVIGTEEQGVFYSNDNGDSWINMSKGLPIDEYGGEDGSFIISLFVDSEDYLYAGTFENGVYRSVTPVTSTESSSFIQVFPNKFNLSQNYPNPFNPSTTIKYQIPAVVDANFASTTNVSLIVYDILGREVATLVNEKQKPGNYEVEFNCHSGACRNLTSGVYFYKLSAGTSTGLSADKAGSATSFIQTKKMLMLK